MFNFLRKLKLYRQYLRDDYKYYCECMPLRPGDAQRIKNELWNYVMRNGPKPEYIEDEDERLEREFETRWFCEFYRQQHPQGINQ